VGLGQFFFFGQRLSKQKLSRLVLLLECVKVNKHRAAIKYY